MRTATTIVLEVALLEKLREERRKTNVPFGRIIEQALIERWAREGVEKRKGVVEDGEWKEG